MYIVSMRHSRDCEPELELFHNLTDAIDRSHQFFEDYDGEIVNGRAYDGGCDSFTTEHQPMYTENAFSIYSNVEIVEGKVKNFVHCEGGGPSCYVEEVEVK